MKNKAFDIYYCVNQIYSYRFQDIKYKACQNLYFCPLFLK